MFPAPSTIPIWFWFEFGCAPFQLTAESEQPAFDLPLSEYL
jgi:hypothetical protein